MQIEALQQQAKEKGALFVEKVAEAPLGDEETREFIVERAQKIALDVSALFKSWSFEPPNKLIIDLGGFWLSKNVASQIIDLGKRYSYEIEMINGDIS